MDEWGRGTGGIYLIYLTLKQAHLALFVSPSALLPQGLNSTLQSLTQEKNGLLSNLSTLEERISSVENENKVLQEKVTSLTEEKTAAENEVVLLKETLQTVEKEKQVSVSASKTLEQIVQFSRVNFCIFKSSRTYSVWQISEFPCVNDTDWENKQDNKIQQERRGRYSIIHVETKFFFSFLSQELWDQIKSSSSEDSKLQGMVESLERMLHDSERKYQVREYI